MGVGVESREGLPTPIESISDYIHVEKGKGYDERISMILLRVF